MKEEWKSIPNYEKYEISNWGRVRKIIKNGYKFCNLRKNKKGYLLISLWNKKYGIKTLSIHRLVAKEFIPNPLNLPQVNHKNEIKIDNKVNNLEWCTGLYNIRYGTGIKRRSKRIKKSEFDLINEEIENGFKY